jgi:hypothetical protein
MDGRSKNEVTAAIFMEPKICRGVCVISCWMPGCHMLFGFDDVPKVWRAVTLSGADNLAAGQVKFIHLLYQLVGFGAHTVVATNARLMMRMIRIRRGSVYGQPALFDIYIIS